MRKSLFFVAVVAVLLVPLQVMAYSVEREYDEFTKQEKVYQEGNRIYTSSMDCRFNLMFARGSEDNRLSMQIRFGTKKPFYLSKTKPSVVFLVDGEPMHFVPLFVHSEYVGSWWNFKEWGAFDIQLEDLKILMNAEELKCRLYGLKRYKDFDDMKKVQKRWREFVAEYVDKVDVVD